jgi:hypothetical protein
MKAKAAVHGSSGKASVKKKKKKVYISNLLLENLHIKQVKFKPSTTGY